MITIYTSEEIEKIAAAGKLTADTLSMLEKAVRPGISTLELDEMAEKFIRSRGGIPSCKGYEGFPGSICASVNDTVVHGIPSARKILKKGDIISLDLVVELNGYNLWLEKETMAERNFYNEKRYPSRISHCCLLGHNYWVQVPQWFN